MEAAIHLNVPPWELARQNIGWIAVALLHKEKKDRERIEVLKAFSGRGMPPI